MGRGQNGGEALQALAQLRGSEYAVVEREQTKLVHARSDDWEAVYVDGELHSEEEKIRISAVVAEVGYRRSELDVEERWVDADWWEDEAHGRFPDDLADVVFDD